MTDIMFLLDNIVLVVGLNMGAIYLFVHEVDFLELFLEKWGVEDVIILFWLFILRPNWAKK